jgi:hypothetical protein
MQSCGPILFCSRFSPRCWRLALRVHTHTMRSQASVIGERIRRVFQSASADRGGILKSEVFGSSAALVVFGFPGQTLGCGDEFEELSRRYGEAVRQPQEPFERNRLFGPLDPSDLVPVVATHLRKLLLGEMPFKSQSPHLFAEQNQCAGHAV